MSEISREFEVGIMREAFELAAWRAGCRAWRSDMHEPENPYRGGALNQLANYWLAGWVFGRLSNRISQWSR